MGRGTTRPTRGPVWGAPREAQSADAERQGRPQEQPARLRDEVEAQPGEAPDGYLAEAQDADGRHELHGAPLAVPGGGGRVGERERAVDPAEREDRRAGGEHGLVEGWRRGGDLERGCADRPRRADQGDARRDIARGDRAAAESYPAFTAGREGNRQGARVAAGVEEAQANRAMDGNPARGDLGQAARTEGVDVEGARADGCRRAHRDDTSRRYDRIGDGDDGAAVQSSVESEALERESVVQRGESGAGAPDLGEALEAERKLAAPFEDGGRRGSWGECHDQPEREWA